MGPALVASIVSIATVCGGGAAYASHGGAISKKEAVVVRDALKSIGKDAGHYEAFALPSSTAKKHHLEGGSGCDSSMIVVKPKRGADACPLLVSGSGPGCVQWWLDGTALTAWQSRAVAAANKVQPTMWGIGVATDLSGFRVVETRACLVFVDRGGLGRSGDWARLDEEARVVLDKASLVESAACDSVARKISVW